MSVQLVRESTDKAIWLERTQYEESVYNISISKNGKLAIFNSATGAVVLMDSDTIINLPTKEKLCLVENGFLVPIGTQEYNCYISKIKIYDKEKPNFFTIIPTTVCNAKCFYCYEEEYCKLTVNDAILDKIINYLSQHLGDNAECVLDWYGGEPLLCVNQIDKIVSTLRARGKLLNRWSSSITTNGTLLSKEIIAHLIQEWHLSVAHITIDGTEKEHNYRKNVNLNGESAFQKTFSGIYELLSAGVYVNLRIHLDHLNKASFPDILQKLSVLFQFEKLHLFPTFLFPPEHSMPESYIKDSEKEELFYDVFKSLLTSKYKADLKDMFPQPRYKGCFATRPNTLVIAPNGDVHACVQDFNTLSMTNTCKYSNFRYALEACKECAYLPICLGGCLYNRNLSNTVRTPCVRNRYIIKPLLKLLIERTI